MIIFIEVAVQDMLLAVVTQALVSPVELSMLMLAVVPLIPPGIWAPPYHLNQLIKIFISNI